MARDRYFESRCVEVQTLCPDVHHVLLEREDSEPMSWTPGQFMMIHFPDRDGVSINRSYSMSSATEPSAPGRFALCVKRVEGGQGSTLIHSLKPGDAITTSGPYGRFVLAKQLTRDVVLVATGTGVAPFRAMIAQLEELLAAGHRIWLLFGVRYDAELLYHAEWEALAARHPAFHYRPIVSRPEAWTGPKGYVQALLPELQAAVDPADTTAYLCGVPDMIDAMRDALQAMGLGMRAIKTEKYVSPPPPRVKEEA